MVRCFLVKNGKHFTRFYILLSKSNYIVYRVFSTTYIVNCQNCYIKLLMKNYNTKSTQKKKKKRASSHARSACIEVILFYCVGGGSCCLL